MKLRELIGKATQRKVKVSREDMRTSNLATVAHFGDDWRIGVETSHPGGDYRNVPYGCPEDDARLAEYLWNNADALADLIEAAKQMLDRSISQHHNEITKLRAMLATVLRPK